MNRITFIILANLIFIVNFVHSTESYTPTENEELYGTWINADYDSKSATSRWDWKSDGTWATYPSTTSGGPLWKGEYSITEKWYDDQGNVWYKVKWKNPGTGMIGYGLIKLSDSGRTMESNYSVGDYPSKIDSTLPFWQYAGFHHRTTDSDTTTKFDKKFNKSQMAVWKEVQNLWAQVKRGDLETVMASLHDDSVIWWRDNPQPLKKDAMRINYKVWIDNEKPISYDLKPLFINISGNFANAYYLYKWNGKDGARIGRTMATYIREDDRWLLYGSSSASCVHPLNCDENI